MADNATAIIRHIGLCTGDIERASRFYQEALGFQPLSDIIEIGAPFDALIEQPGATLRVQQLKAGDATIELLGYKDLDVTGSADRCSMNRLGFTHMTLVVDDMEASIARICEFGGQVHPQTRVDSPFGQILFCTDPDGVRIELMQAAP